VTSRAPLRLRGEREFPVSPLPLPDPKRLPPVERLRQYAAVELFIQRAVAAKPDFTVTNESVPTVAEICHCLDGLPLAIELAAARVRLFTPQGLLSRLGSRLKLLVGGPRDLPVRQQTLRSTIAWSYDLLAEFEQQFFRSLSVFAGGCTLQAAEAVGNTEGDLEIRALSALGALVDHGLLRQEETAEGEPRFTMLETIREYGLECLAAHGEEVAIRRRHLDFFFARVEEGRGWVWLEREYDNLRAALDWSIESREADIGLRLAEALGVFWNARGYLVEGQERLERLLKMPGAEARTKLRARALCNAGVLATSRGDYVGAQRHLEESLEIEREVGTDHYIPELLNSLGFVHACKGNHELARAFHEESMAIYSKLGNQIGIAESLANLGEVARLERDCERATAFYDESLTLARETGSKWFLRWGLSNRGELACFQGEYRRAAALFQESLALSREDGDLYGTAVCLAGLGGVAGGEEQPKRGALLLGAAAGLLDKMGAVWQPVERAAFEHYLATVRHGVDVGAFTAAWEEGREMSLDQALACALEDTSSRDSE
jgi:predicted ATPase